MSPENHRRLAEIETERRQHVDALARLSDEASAILAALAGAGQGAKSRDVGMFQPKTTEATKATNEIIALDPNLTSVRVAAKRLARSESWVRQWAKRWGASVRHGGGRLIDMRIMLQKTELDKI